MKKKLLLVLFLISILTIGCSPNVKMRFDTPDDEVSMVCEHGKLGKVPVICGDYDQFVNSNQKFSRAGLVMVIEVGTFAANRGLGDQNPFSAMLRSGALASMTDIQPHIRPLLHNLFLAFMERTLQGDIRRYDQVYIAHLPGNQKKGLKRKFLDAISAATKTHPKVDLMMVGHAITGEILMSPDLEKRNEAVNLTAQQLVQFSKKKLSASERNKVRAIFQTHCYVAKKNTEVPAGHAASMYEAYAKSFPKSEFYGSVGVNTFPLHRDFVMFEKFYQTLNFKLAHRLAVRTIKTTPHNGDERTRIVFPSLRIKGCIDLFFGDKCENRTVSTGTVGTRASIQKLIDSSMPIYGNATMASTASGADR